jgi:hypothetical protein
LTPSTVTPRLQRTKEVLLINLVMVNEGEFVHKVPTRVFQHENTVCRKRYKREGIAPVTCQNLCRIATGLNAFSKKNLDAFPIHSFWCYRYLCQAAGTFLETRQFLFKHGSIVQMGLMRLELPVTETRTVFFDYTVDSSHFGSLDDADHPCSKCQIMDTYFLPCRIPKVNEAPA